MNQSLWERFKFWVCDTFGHRNLKLSHSFNRKRYYNCKFCGRMQGFKEKQ